MQQKLKIPLYRCIALHLLYRRIQKQPFKNTFGSWPNLCF
ncbi:hypothetical protein B4100_0880 [Heyndrickxia coagulans]|nr:hypothetical protein B4100_0880 [Heyndrickxia coagulans]